jgi:SAM-dependent methyltransferase
LEDKFINTFDQANAGYRFNERDELSFYKEKRLVDIVDRYCRGQIDIKAPPTKRRIEEGIWKTYEYFRALKPEEKGPGKPEDTLVKAIELLNLQAGRMNHLTAIDLGCGEGRDTLKMLQEGFEVHAIDPNETALKRLEFYAGEANLRSKLNLDGSSFENLNLLKMTENKSVQLLNASWSLPYADEHFDHAIREVKEMVDKGAVFSGTFFGDHDDLKKEVEKGISGTKLLTDQQMDQLFPDSKYERIQWDSREYDGKRVDGSKKHWHVWHVIVKKKNVTAKEYKPIHGGYPDK